MMAKTLMTHADLFSNKKLLVTRDYRGIARFLTQCVVKGSGYSIGQNTAERTSYGNNGVTWMQVIMDPLSHCSKYRHVWTLYIYTVLGVADSVSFHGV